MKSNILKYIFVLFVIGIIGYSAYKLYYNKGEQPENEIVNDVKTQSTMLTNIRIGISNFDNINPLISNNRDVINLSTILYEPLCSLTNDYHLELKLAKEYLINEESSEDYGVVALDLAGAEALYKTEQFIDVFKLANELNVPFTIHAGEADGAESVKKAVEFGAKRIGHGVRSVENLALMKALSEKKICLEMCPTSNLQTKAIEKIEDFPIREFMKLGIPVTINTDDMAICGTDMGHEMNLIRNKFDITDNEESEIYANAVRYSFAKNKIKKQLMEVQ